jgi:MerR family transcriptional regulator, repressor of the yfmOP operon
MGRPAPSDIPPSFRIGEVAKLTGLTTRTLRYWEELGLIRPSGYRGRGERLYSQTDMARVIRIRDLQELLGFSLAEVSVVLEVEDIDVLDRVRSEYRWGGAGATRRRALIEEAIEANDKLLARLDSTLSRIGAFRDERAEKAVHLRETRDALVEEIEAKPPAHAAASAATSTRTAKKITGRSKERANERGKERGKNRDKEGANQR